MKEYSYLFQKEIQRLEKRTEGISGETPDKFMLKFLKEAAETDIIELSDEIYKCLRAWPCMKTVLILMMWLMLRERER